MKRIGAALLLLTLPTALTAGTHFWIIGGGPTPRESQAQIEFNVVWVIASLRELVPDAAINVFYANGNGPEMATVEHIANDVGVVEPFEALARVYGEHQFRRVRYREHRVPNVIGSTHADSLVPALRQQLAALEPGDQAMIVYNGHGSWAPDHAHNALRLWDETSLDVAQFETLLDEVEPSVPVRFLFTQCYSGAFERAVHPDAADVLELAEGTRCGFFAESADRLSEGCSASIRVGDYQDYTTYFFAALTGRTRLGEAVGGRVDWDGDGRVTPFDAHVFALVEGRNADLPRSTSEVYLERWQPWYVRWMGTDRVPENLYGQAATQMATDMGLPSGSGLGAAMESRYAQLVADIAEATARQAELGGEVGEIQARLRSSAGRRWPELSHPYAADSQAIMGAELSAVEAHITGAAEYADLVRAQESLDENELRLVELDRDLGQLDRLRRTRLLARSLAQMERHGSAGDREAYARLRACEALPLE